MEEMIIIGAGAAGLSAALELAKNNIKSVLVADMPSQRAQSVMAEGGINAAFPSDADSPALHAEETLRAGRYLADPSAVRDLTENAPKIIEELFAGGMAFTLNSEREPDTRAFGGQSVKRTYYAASGTGKQLMQTLTGQVRRYEAEGLIHRMTGWLFLRLLWEKDRVCGCILTRTSTGEETSLRGRVIICSGGLNGMFGNATGSVGNTGGVTASLFADGVAIANGEFIQYHPTTALLHGKNMLITEAVRGEGGRLLTLRDGKPYYFMEEKYPELGNLMPRDIIAREEWTLMQQGQQIYLDMRHLDKTVLQDKLHGVVEDCREFLSLDPAKEMIPVVPGIHYFMGGIRVDRHHRTDRKGLYAAGECACQYHGANRLGGNSLLGAMYGGKRAAISAMEDSLKEGNQSDENRSNGKLSNGKLSDGKLSDGKVSDGNYAEEKRVNEKLANGNISDRSQAIENHLPGNYTSQNPDPGSYVDGMLALRRILKSGLGIVRDAESIQAALTELMDLREKLAGIYDPSASVYENQLLQNCCLLGQAMLMSADARKESRGAHTRSDFPEERPEYQKQTVARLSTRKLDGNTDEKPNGKMDGEIIITFESAGEEDAY